jgi:hypothetical protein
MPCAFCYHGYLGLTLSQLALNEHDDKQLYIARQNLSDLRNVYAVMMDILHKNISKVSPVSSIPFVIRQSQLKTCS